MSTVTIVCPNARRCQVKVTPSTLLRKVFEEACKLLGYDAAHHELRHQKKVLDLSLPFRLSGLPNNVTVDLAASSVTASSKVDLAVQVDTTRYLVSVSPSETLYSVFEKISAENKTDLLSVFEGAVPCCSYMNKQYRGAAELQATTLLSMGITSGRCLIRYQRIVVDEERLNEIQRQVEEERRRKEELDLIYALKKAENESAQQLEEERLKRFEEELRNRPAPEEQPMDVSPPAPTPPPPPSSLLTPPIHSSGWSFDRPVFSFQPPAQPSRLDNLNALLQQVDASLSSGRLDDLSERLINERGQMSITAETVRSIVQPEIPHILLDKCERNALLFEKEKQNEEEVGDEFFQVNVDDLKSIQRQLRAEVKAHADRALIPQSAVEKKNQQAKHSAYKNSVIRFQIAPNILIQGCFRSREPSGHLHDFLSSVLLPGSKFSLHFILNQKIDNNTKKNLVDLDLAPTATLIVKNLQDGVLEPLETCPRVSQSEADSTGRTWLAENTTFTPFVPVQEETGRTPVVKRPADRSPPPANRPTTNNAAPKWLKKNR